MKRVYGVIVVNRKNRCCWFWSLMVWFIVVKYVWLRSVWLRFVFVVRFCLRMKCCLVRWKLFVIN